MTQIPGEPLGQLMEALDGTRFSHSGIAVRVDGRDGPATHLASALLTLLDGDGFDLGGVRWDPFHELWAKHRDLYCIPMPGRRERALARLRKYRPEPDREGTFSLVKLVAVAVALRAVEVMPRDAEHAESLFAAACDIATAWAATDDEPAYYCAELVADAYDLTFTRADMVPPRDATGVGGDVAEPRWIGRLAERLSEALAGTDGSRGAAWARLVAALAGDDWDFVVHAIGASTRSVFFLLRGHGDGPVQTPGPLLPPREGHPGLELTDVPIPHALVTPRMLWAAFGRDTIRKVEREG